MLLVVSSILRLVNQNIIHCITILVINRNSLSLVNLICTLVGHYVLGIDRFKQFLISILV